MLNRRVFLIFMQNKQYYSLILRPLELNNGLETICKEVVVVYFKILSAFV
jgi:hypothetical protein